MVTRRLALTRADLDDGVCTVPAVDDREQWTVALEHLVKGIRPVRPVFAAGLRQDDDGWRLTGIDWPDDLRPGVLVRVAWRPEILIRTVALAEPMRVDGVSYFHEYDPAVVTREYQPDKSNRGQVLHAVRRLGRVFEDGSALFAEPGLAARAGLGRGTRGAFLLRNAVEQLIREGYITRVPGSVNAEGQPAYPAADGQEPAELLLYAPLVEPAPHPDDPDDPDADAEHSERREHWVNGFLRKLPPGAQPSERQLALHQQTAEEDALPPGYTFVKKHHRNG